MGCVVEPLGIISTNLTAYQGFENLDREPVPADDGQQQTEPQELRRVQDYRKYAECEQLEQRVRELNAAQKMDAEIAAVLNAEGFCSAQGKSFYGALVFLLRKQWRIATVKINGTY